MSNLLKGRYQVTEVFEAGGFGQTYLAIDKDKPSLRKCVIKKLIPQSTAERAKFNSEVEYLKHIRSVQERFDREAVILERLGDFCDQIPALYAYFVENNEFYLVQEFIEGQTLRKKLQLNGVLDENTVRDLLWSLLGVLEYVHSQNIIHRDIKPDNIILRERDNKPVLIDFGIVKEVLGVDIYGNLTHSTLPIGTRGYIALEQAAGRPVYTSDIYSLGATAIFLLTGRNPHQLGTSENGDIIWQPFAPQVSAGFVAFLNKATKTNVLDRFESATKMREDLLKIMRGEPIIFIQNNYAPTETETVINQIPQPQSFKQEPQKSNYKLPFIFAVSAILFLIGMLFVGALALFFSLNSGNRETSQVANTQNMNLTSNLNKTLPQTPNSLNSNSENNKQKDEKLEIKKERLQNDEKAKNNNQPNQSSTSNTKTESGTTKAGAAIVFAPPSNIRNPSNGDILCSVNKKRTIRIYSLPNDENGGWIYTDVCGKMGLIHESQIRF